MLDQRNHLVLELLREFPAEPIPPYPPMMGMDPMGHDEYSHFAGQRWTDVPAEYLERGYDISPPIGFRSCEPPHMWNYHIPGFIRISLLYEGEYDVVDNFLWGLRNSKPLLVVDRFGDDPWWFSDTVGGNYSTLQIRLIVNYLKYMQQFGVEPQYQYDWGGRDDEMLSSWMNHLAAAEHASP
ncbi:hypothetical protein LF1_00400 [Rubripirellula obstinata]|uniref:Uncharacterized protein n=1 Tax=Rubripirellula obstinata TaxID=406547 RepID=A0A5B1CDM5_9BACT|nr:hypothetical protein [Rubripirellula obstinata]KAA1256874.1 hypothetical protein LF1_58270 [Rubripirellula obstinata]KAA1256938.1 hypothetical protein LF1_57720 [Rubripirellula obstinata]KAA1257553.1 hypothetical protein LF1_00400 [Rubripirellula obstinata]